MKISKIRQFTNGIVGVLQTEDGRLLETTSTCLPMSTEIRFTENKDNRLSVSEYKESFWKQKWMIGVSTQSGCPIKCRFCAVNRLTERDGSRNLSSDEIFRQVEIAIKETQKLTDTYIVPEDAQIFRVLFTRMGEPAMNIDNVIAAIRKIKNKWPFARIQISTFGIAKTRRLIERLIEVDKEYDCNDWLELQFSIHSTDMNYRRWLQTGFVLDNSEIARLASKFYNARNRKWKVTLNFALAQDSPFNIQDLSKTFDPSTVFIKVSPINENPVSDENRLKSLFNYENNI